MDNSQVYSDDVVNIANSLLNDLKNSYQVWEDLISKCSKFHSALKVATQASSAFLDAFQKVADLATKTLGGSKEIGGCLTRYCMRQKSLESKVKSMSNHLVTSLANPLSLKVDEWKRNLYQLEKDRTRQTKRARAELKKALCEAHKWEKKAAKIGTTGNIGVGPGVGHGIIPSTNVTCSNSESNAVNVQAAKAQCEVGLKKELVENTEKSAIRLLLLEERSRFCFFVSCLIPILECQSSMLNEIATIDELIKILTKETEYPDQLVEDVESIVLRMGLRDISVSSRNGSKIMSVFVPDNGDRVNNMNEVIGSLFITNGNRSCTNSSDTESGRHGSDMVSPYRICRDSNTVGRCNSVCDSADISLCGASSNSGSGGSNCPSLLSPVRSNVAHLGSRESSLISVDSATSGSGNTNSAYSIGLSNTNIPHSDPEETQFKTLCRPGHCRAASNGDNGDFPIYLKNGFHHDKTDSVIAKSMIAFNAQSKLIDGQNYSIKRNDDIENVKRDKSENKLSVNTEDEDHDGDDDDDDGEDGGEYVEVGSDSGSKLGYLSNNHTSPSLSNSMNQHFSLESCPSSSVTTATTGDPPIPNNGRHTISSAYERGIHAPARASITALSFNSPVGKTASKDSGVDSSAVLYPKQAVPPPVYTNLIQLAHAAQRKFSMSQLPIVHSYENVDNNALDRLRYDKIDMNSCQQFSNPHHSPNRNSISMNPQQYHQLTNVSPNTATSNNYNWSVSGSLNKLHLNDSGKSQTNSDEKYVKPSSGLKSPVEKLTSSTSLSSSCFGSKNCLDNVSTSDVTAASTTVVSNNGIHSYQRSGTDPFSLEMDELDQVMPVNVSNNIMTLNRFTPKHVHNRLTFGALPSYHPSLYTASNVSLAGSCFCLTNTELLSKRNLCCKQNFPVSCDQLNEGVVESTVNLNYQQDLFAPHLYTQQSHDEHSSYSNSDESDVKVCDSTVGRHPPFNHHHSMMILQRTTSDTNNAPFPPTNVNRSPPPIQPKPIHLKHISSISQYHLNRKTTESTSMSRPCPPRRTCSILSSSSLVTSGVSMPCDLNVPDLSSSPHQCKDSYEGSSRGSSITMASSTTNDSLPSSNGSPALLGYHATSNINNNNTRKSISFNQNSLNNEQALENKSHYATPVIKNSSYQCSAAAGQVSSLLKQSSLVSNPVCMNNELTNPQTVYETKDVSDRIATTPPPPPPPPPLPIFPSPSLSTNSSIIPHSSLVEIAPAKSDCAENPSTNLVSVETANLMSELSSQLQQLAARTNDINFSPSKSNFKTNNAFSHHKECIKHNEFDLPPPPPSSMFTEQYCSGVVKSDCPSIRTTNISSTSSKSTVNNPGEEIIDDEDSNMNSSPFLLALKQSVKQRADRLAAKNSTNV